ncbi:transmembrane protein domain-containing protein [Ditylenchus destructor]|uniref:Transmembrane protein 138 n=1 Tax=Ditylenchus destructor TaxID=166010 RepID=A0AAD4R0Y3_9BILA|nr:transmembrane protein domain-containing protein [Ditylenchus destructor]
MSESKYSFVLALHLFILLLDMGFNTASTILFQQNTVQLLLFILQDTLVVMAIIVMIIMFSSTFVFQAGLIPVLLKKFSATIFICLAYLFISIAYHVFSLKERWGSNTYIWPTYITVLYVLQRTAAIFYYFLYKRTILLISEPKLHYDSDWLREKVRKYG